MPDLDRIAALEADRAFLDAQAEGVPAARAVRAAIRRYVDVTGSADLVERFRREAQLSREATEKAVASRIARHEIERALRAVDVYDDVASDEDVLFHDGAAHAVRVIRDVLGLVGDACRAPGYNGRHVAVGAGAVGSPPYVCHGCGGTFTPGDSDG